MPETKIISVTRRVTTPFIEAIPPHITHFDAYIYAVVKRKTGMDLPQEAFGVDVRIDPATLNWNNKTITATIPLNINAGISSVKDLHPDWFEMLEASFLALMHGMIP